MANKATKQLRVKIRAACKAGESTVEHLHPVFNYHSAGDNDDFRSRPSSFFTRQLFPTAIPNADGVNSSNKRRNSCQRIYTNMGENRRSSSLTCHEPFLQHERMTFKGHSYIEYRNPNTGPTAPVTASA